MDPGEARRLAALKLGNVAGIEEAVRDVRGRWPDDLVRDLRYALRTLRRSSAFSIVAVLSFALGIGANVAIFSLVNAVMLRKLPVRDPDRLVQITRVLDGHPGQVSYPLFEAFRDNVKSISGAFAHSTSSLAAVIDGQEEFVTADLVTEEYYSVLGIEPAVGRLLGPADAKGTTTPGAVISDRYWQRRFGRSPSALGKAVTARGQTFTIVGVTPAAYEGPRTGQSADVTFPLLPSLMNEAQRSASDFNWLKLLARLRPGATVEQADAEAQVIFASFVRGQAARADEKERAGILRQRAGALRAPDGFNALRDNIAQPLLILMAIVALILLLACLNLSGLLLARAEARQREISIRLAIGAGRGRLVRQFLTESLVLAAVGALVGLPFAGWLSAKLFALFVNGRDLVVSVSPDRRVLAFTALVAILSCCLAGLAPALRAVRANVNPALKEVRVRGQRRFGRILVVAQLAISMVLVVGATLFVGTLIALRAVDRGFAPGGVLVVSVRAAQPYPPPRTRIVQQALIDRLASMPDVRSATTAAMLPLGGGLWDRRVQVEGYTFRPEEQESVGFNVIGPAYFATIGTPVLAGREFDARDTERSPKTAIVNESFARHFFGNASPLGRHVTSVRVTYEIVGVVRDAKYQDLRSEVMKTMYIPWTQREGDPLTRYSYLLRVGAGDPQRLIPGLDRLVREIDPALHLQTATTYDTVVDRSMATERIMATLGGLFGLLAVIVAGLGVFGVLAFQVAQRTNELGVRMALGATRAKMVRLVLRDVVTMVLAGVAIGAGAALAATGLVRKVLFGLTATDPAAFLVAGLVLAGAAIAAAWLPARRAARVDPLVALRHE
jgi:predicted permease